jgi:uncharacterized LabA/DUF88 family protein
MSNGFDLQKRVGVFIDVQNIYHSAKNLYQSRINFNELVKIAVGKRLPVKILAYVVRSDPSTGEEYFFEMLKKSGIELRIKDLQVYPDGTKKGDWDVGISIDAIRFSNNLDVVVLVTGDGDFAPLVQYLKWGLGKSVEIIGFSHTTSLKLKELADEFIDIEKIPKALLKIKKEKKVKIK